MGPRREPLRSGWRVKKNNEGLGLLLAIVGGYAIGSSAERARSETERKSRAELEDPELVAAVIETVSIALEDVTYEARDCEDEYRDEMADDLAHITGLEVEIAPATGFGLPDILVEGVLAIEVKRGLDKASRDRTIGQCADYSRRWVTWIVVFESTPSQVQRLQDVLCDKGLDHIEVIPFCASNDGDLDDDDDDEW